MRYAGWYPRRRGILEHLESGTISLLDAAVHDFLCLTANYRTGVARVSAEKIRALCPSDITLRAIQRSLAHLEKIGWIKRFRTHGQRGNYPVAIGKFRVISGTDGVTDASPKWMSVSLERTTDWRNIQFDLVTDPSLSEELSCHSRVTDRDTDVSPVKEGRSEKQDSLRDQRDGASLRCASGFTDPFSYCGLKQAQMRMSRKFAERFDRFFKSYVAEISHANPENGCTCSAEDFLENVMIELKSEGIRWPRALLARKKQIEAVS